MVQTPKDPASAVGEIAEILSMYSKFNSREDYVTLLEGLEHLMTELREEVWQKVPRKKRREKELRFNYGPANVPLQPIPNVATRSHMVTSDLSSLTLPSHSKPGPSPLKEAKPPSISDQKPTIIGRPNAADKQFEPAVINHGSAPPSAQARPATTDMGMPARDKLKQAIERCKESYRGKTFIVNNDERSETVLPNEINRFFSFFQEGEWLANYNLMPLLFSFRWPPTTLVLHSSYTPLRSSKTGGVQWPIRHDHDRIILPCCFRSHWTLYDIDLKRNSIQHYDSLTEDASKPGEIVSAIKERLANAMEEWERPNRDFITVGRASQQQENGSDCGIYMIYNADCLASDQDTMEEQIDGIQLRYRYLERLVELERQGCSERQIVEMVLPPNKILRIKRRRVLEDMLDGESDEGQQGSRKSRRVEWRPPSHLGPQDAWIEQRKYLAATISKQRYGRSKQECGERAEELLRMIEAIGCEDVMTAWDEAIAQGKLSIGARIVDSTAKAICQLIERAQVRSFKDKVLLRIGKWIFTMKILQDVERLKKEGAPSRQSVLKAEADVRGHALKRAFTKFLEEAHPELQGPNLDKERDGQYCKYRNWWREGQIWVLLYNAFGAAVLLLIPGGQRANGLCSVSNQQYVDIKSSDREPFIKALQKLRPDLKKTVSELDDHLKVLKGDIADLIGRLQHPHIFQELKIEQPNGNS